MTDRRSSPRNSVRILILGALLAGAGAWADTVTLGGTVASTASITSSPTADAIALVLGGGTGEHIVKVAGLAMSTNNSTGLTLSITSGMLSNSAEVGGTSSADIAFMVQTVVVAATPPVHDAFTVPSGSTNSGFASSASGAATRDLYIAYTPAAVQDPGNYSGLITLTVADN